MNQNGNNFLALTFLHPNDSAETFELGVAPQATGEMTLAELRKGDDEGPWLPAELPGRPFELVLERTQRQIQPAQSLGEAGVVTGDRIAVTHPGQGA